MTAVKMPFFLIIFTILSVVNSINQDFWNYEILLLISAFILFLQLKIIKSRNEVKIISRIIASILYILNFICSIKICFDKSLKNAI